MLFNVVNNYDGICVLSERDKMLISSNRDKLTRYSSALDVYLNISGLDKESRQEAYDYISIWNKSDLNPEDLISLLKYNFSDNHIRLYAISQLNKLDDFLLNKYLLQLIEAIKNEIHHQSFLSRFLIYRALRNPLQIGHYLFWYIKSQLFNNIWYYERYALLIEEYLTYLPQCDYYKLNLIIQIIIKFIIINDSITENSTIIKSK